MEKLLYFVGGIIVGSIGTLLTRRAIWHSLARDLAHP